MKRIFGILILAGVLVFWVGASLAALKGTLVVCDDVQDPVAVDPHKEFAEKAHAIVVQMFEGLLKFTSDGEFEPALATSWNRLSDLKVQFKLREGVKFHNGEPFNAKSVKFSIERYLNPTTKFPALGFVNSLDSVEIVDDYTVNVVTKFPDGILFYRLAFFIMMVPPEYLNKIGEEEFGRHPVGTGPFKFVRWDKGKQIVMEAYEGYWRKEFPNVKRLLFKFVPSAKQVGMLLNGELDIVTELPGTYTLKVMRSKGVKIIKSPTLSTVFASLNNNKGPLGNRKVRQALNYAINKEMLIKYDVKGNGREIATLTMLGEFGHNPHLKPYTYDIQKAKKLLTEAGYPDGFKLDVVVKAQGERTGKIISEQLRKIGIKVTLTTTTDAKQFDDFVRKDWDAFIAQCPDPMYHAYFIQGIAVYSKSPFSRVKSEKYDELYEKMISTIDPYKQKEIAYKLDEFLYNEALSIFTYQRIKTYGVRNNVNFAPYIGGVNYFYGASIIEDE
jgi:peptide/nickel transport system substrate-binding protein